MPTAPLYVMYRIASLSAPLHASALQTLPDGPSAGSDINPRKMPGS